VVGVLGLADVGVVGGLVGSGLDWPWHCCQLLALFAGCPSKMGINKKDMFLLLFEKSTTTTTRPPITPSKLATKTSSTTSESAPRQLNFPCQEFPHSLQINEGAWTGLCSGLTSLEMIEICSNFLTGHPH